MINKKNYLKNKALLREANERLDMAYTCGDSLQEVVHLEEYAEIVEMISKTHMINSLTKTIEALKTAKPLEMDNQAIIDLILQSVSS